MIGFFDSGLGGLTILHAFMELRLGSYVYLGDNARAPYGSRSAEEVERFTIQGVKWLIDQGCGLIVLACNTASANALRSIQKEWLPKYAPHVRVLGVLVPTVEAVTGLAWQGDETKDHDLSVMVFATPTTVASHAYEREILKRLPRAKIVSEACPELVSLIEGGVSREEIARSVKFHTGSALARAESSPNVVLLGCTHYALIEDVFRAAFSSSLTSILSQPRIVAQSLREYLIRHPDVASSLSLSALFFTTGDPDAVAAASRPFFGDALRYEHVSLE